jgi:hypothetical protein
MEPRGSTEPSPLQRERWRRPWLTQQQVGDGLKELAWRLGHGELGIDPNAVSRHERGVVRCPRWPLPELYAAFYETTVEALWPGGTVGGAGVPETRSGDVERREFTRLAGGIATGLAGGRLFTDPDPDEAVARATTITARYRRDDERVASSELLGPVLRHLDTMVRRLRGDHRRHAALGAAASEAAGFAGWLWFDMDSPGAARARYKQAVRHAEQAGNSTLRAYMLGSLSALASYAGDRAAAVRLANDAGRGLGADSPAVSRAWLAASEAVAYATAGDERACMVALDRAEAASDDAAGQGHPSWPWMLPFDRAKVAAYRGSCLVRLGRPIPARSALLSALSARTAPTKQNALLLVDLAHAHVQRGDQEEGCRLLGEAYAVAVAKRSERVARRVLEVRRDLSPRAAATRQLDQQLLASWL